VNEESTLPISYSHPKSDLEIFESQMKATRGQLAKVSRELETIRAQRERDPYEPQWQQKLPPLTEIKNRLEHQLRDQESSWRSAGGSTGEGSRALSSGAFWLPPDA
jgi:hypothetical protein